MSKLSPEARSLFDAAREADGPSADDRARVRSKLALRLGAGAAVGTALGSTVATGSAAAGAKAAGFTGLAMKLLATAAIVVGLGGGAYVATHPSTPPAVLGSGALSQRGNAAAERASHELAMAPPEEAPASTTPQDAEPAPAAATASTTAPASPPSTTSAPAAPHPPRASAAVAAAPPEPASATDAPSPLAGAAPAVPGVAPAAAPRNALAEETALIGEAQAALRQGQPDAALRALDQHNARFGAGALRDERAGTRILALCAAGRVDEARTEAARFLRDSPRSPMAARVRASCAGR